jgi:hypothetical protein
VENALDPFSFFSQHHATRRACESTLFSLRGRIILCDAICAGHLLAHRARHCTRITYSPSALFICLFVHHAAHCDVRCGCTRRQNNFSQSVKSIPRAPRSTHLSERRTRARGEREFIKRDVDTLRLFCVGWFELEKESAE